MEVDRPIATTAATTTMTPAAVTTKGRRHGGAPEELPVLDTSGTYRVAALCRRLMTVGARPVKPAPTAPARASSRPLDAP